MPIKVPNNLPAVETLTEENIFVMTDTRAMTQDIRPLQIVILNLMPTKVETETQLTRLLGNSPLQVELELLQTKSHKSQNISEEHMIAFYKTFDQIKDKYYDGMIITGAPIELMEFEEIDYWEELCHIMEWSKTHVHSTFHICWGAQAGLYYHYGIKKYKLHEKLSGVYKHRLVKQHHKLFRGFDDEFFVPHSRNTTVLSEDIEACGNLEILSVSEEAGIFALVSKNQRQIFITGHSEYDEDTLLKEYERDVKAGINPKVPTNYFPDDDDSKEPVVKWRSCANLLYSNWLNYFVYQSTPYEIEKIKESDFDIVMPDVQNCRVSKFGGTSLCSGKQMKKVKKIVEGEETRGYVVVSAPGKRYGTDEKITDLLNEAIKAETVEKKSAVIETVKDRFSSIKKELETDEGIEINLDLDGEFKELESFLIGEKSADSHARAFVLSRGEYLCAKLMAQYLNYAFVDSYNLIRFTEEGRFDEKETKKLVDKELSGIKNVVIPGFYGSDKEGNVRLFPRGGSDITGAVIAACLGADLYENWTDVSGIFMADPGIVDNPKSARVITYKELRELSYMGASVLHEDSVLPVMKKEIPIRILNTNMPEDEGSLIVKKSNSIGYSSPVTGVAGKKGYVFVYLEGAKLGEDPSQSQIIMELMRQEKLNSESIITSIDGLTIMLNKAENEDINVKLEKFQELMSIEYPYIRISITEDIALITVVGRDMAESPEVTVKLLNCLSTHRISIKFMDHGPSKINIMVGVDESEYENAIKAIYNQLCA